MNEYYYVSGSLFVSMIYVYEPLYIYIPLTIPEMSSGWSYLCMNKIIDFNNNKNNKKNI